MSSFHSVKEREIPGQSVKIVYPSLAGFKPRTLYQEGRINNQLIGKKPSEKFEHLEGAEKLGPGARHHLVSPPAAQIPLGDHCATGSPCRLPSPYTDLSKQLPSA